MIRFFTEWWQYGFMRNAFVAVLIITPLFGMLGTMIVERKMAYFSDALGHSALTGIAIGVVFGAGDTNLSMMLFAAAFALILNKLGSTGMAANDTVISVVSSFSIAHSPDAGQKQEPERAPDGKPVCRTDGADCNRFDKVGGHSDYQCTVNPSGSFWQEYF